MFDWDPVHDAQSKLAVIETGGGRPTVTTLYRCNSSGAA
jgi:hypothetical protein